MMIHYSVNKHINEITDLRKVRTTPGLEFRTGILELKVEGDRDPNMSSQILILTVSSNEISSITEKLEKVI
ncbi:6699_t:CDS:2 [Rhizophagus irregularis]|nr:6699_t:CDS:2 [Rhizophagus irregularis]